MSRPLRVAFLTDYFGSLAGTEASLVATAMALHQRDHEVAVCAFPRDEPIHPYWRDSLEAAGIPLVVRDGVGRDGTAEDRACMAMAAWLAEWRPDLLHFIPAGDLAFVWFRQGLLPSVPAVGTETSEASARCFWYASENFSALMSFDVLIAPCASVARGMREYFGYRGALAVVPHIVPVDDAELTPLDSHDLARANELGAITRVRVEKAPEFMLAAVALAARAMPRLTLTIYGEAPERERALEVGRALGIGDRVRIAGPFRDTQEIGTIIRRHPLFLLSSLFESLPLAVLHVAARGRVTVATDVGGVREFLGDIDDDLVVTPGDSGAMAAATLRWLERPERLLEAGRRSQLKFREMYHPGVVVPQLVDLYRRTLARRHLRDPVRTADRL